MQSQPAHLPVLFHEVLQALEVKPSGVYVDGTFGRGGHAAAILARLDDQGMLVVMDKDPEAIAVASQRFAGDPRVKIVEDDFLNMAEHLKGLQLTGRVNGILLDLGVSSPQLDDPLRGFSFQHNGPLDMRMNPQAGESAAQWLANADERQIADVLWRYGEERHSRRIARHIVAQRAEQPIQDTASLASLIAQVMPGKPQKIHPATRSFQAIRIWINRELEHLERFLEGVVDLLAIGGRLAIISFHSLEDRLVKRFMKRESSPAVLPRGLPVKHQDQAGLARLSLIGKVLTASAEEIECNPRARSAKLRVAQRLA